MRKDIRLGVVEGSLFIFICIFKNLFRSTKFKALDDASAAISSVYFPLVAENQALLHRHLRG